MTDILPDGLKDAVEIYKERDEEMAKNKVGRPTIMTEEVVEKLVQAFHDGANIVEACKSANIDRKTYYNTLESDKDFSTLMEDAQRYPDVIAKMNLVRAMKRNDIDVSKWWAERRMKGEFSTRNELTGKDGEKLEAQPVLVKFVGLPNGEDN